VNTQLTELNGFRIGDVCRVKSGRFKGMVVTIYYLQMAQYVNMKEPKAYASVQFPAGNSWEFQLNNLRKD